MEVIVMEENKASFNWYPGHMTKAKRMMQEDIKFNDIVIELIDARIPMSSRNPDIDDLAKNKYRLILLNKSDLADERVTVKWVEFFEKQGIKVIKLDSRQRSGMKSVNNAILEVCKEKIERDRKRGIINRPVRAMIVGIPNVGKSTFINSFAGKACAKTGNKPGVTKGKQWIRLNKTVELLDTPGILWPKFDNEKIANDLAFIGSINDQILNLTELSLKFIESVKNDYAGIFTSRYDIEEKDDGVTMLGDIAIARGCLKKGGEPDYDKAAALIFDDFRSGKLGKISIEKPEDYIS
ncbi:ribosome biogenesis GTPase YlqF [Eshraghiella crossota]|jgi:ribosome biogenesis GTPase A|uniref:ribosome biogenesis GTPase YlqF n=1 Tax=Eshraghiella crossota TaxID=45851 RepID=UPI000E7D899B|nr:ribosome biogenesis GTPase YlqF [Butyrivibrio crossotus]MBS6452366.1 ribosome biogenesis GTPase YlqF [Butyrivibrio sp.]HAI91712.1 ribosome biogenesis GTPase YlqF [Butyrivibrio sp.]HAX06534.1 ribosome biogenesis GTPase YlqF [Butyrivibrio sp.]